MKNKRKYNRGEYWRLYYTQTHTRTQKLTNNHLSSSDFLLFFICSFEMGDLTETHWFDDEETSIIHSHKTFV